MDVASIPGRVCLRLAIIACVLFVYFEMLRDSCDVTINHIQHGLIIVQQFIYTTHDILSPEPSAGKEKSRAELPNPSVLNEEILSVF